MKKNQERKKIQNEITNLQNEKNNLEENYNQLYQVYEVIKNENENNKKIIEELNNKINIENINNENDNIEKLKEELENVKLEKEKYQKQVISLNDMISSLSGGFNMDINSYPDTQTNVEENK